MKLSRKFVSDYIDINDDINTVAEKMTGVGNEYDSAGKLINATNLVIGEVLECDMHPDTVGLIINRAPKGELNKGIQEEIANQGLTLLGVVPQDETVYEYDCEGRPTSTLPEDNPVKTALRAIVDNLKL